MKRGAGKLLYLREPCNIDLSIYLIILGTRFSE
jgi:hypothetical protein